MTKREIENYFGVNSHSEGKMPQEWTILAQNNWWCHKQTLVISTWLWLLTFDPSQYSVPEYEVATPYQSDEGGKYISFELNQQSSRERRDAEEGPNPLFYSMKVFGNPLHVRVTRSPDVVSRGTVVETVYADGSTTRSDVPKTSHYLGHVTSDPSSFVALSNDNGLVTRVAFQLSIAFLFVFLFLFVTTVESYFQEHTELLDNTWTSFKNGDD